MTSMPPPPARAPAGAPSVPLGGTWRAAVADEALRRSYPDPDFDDDDWEPLSVPGHWSSSPALAGTSGGVLHRRRFDTPDPFGPGAAAGERRTWLVFDGVFYTSDVWLDGTYVGDTEGYFVPHAFEVTGAMADRHEHTLAVEVACRTDDPAGRRTLLGAFGTGAAGLRGPNAVAGLRGPNAVAGLRGPNAVAGLRGPNAVAGLGGLWRPVRLEQSGPVRIAHLRVICTEVTDEAATVAVRAVLDSARATTVEAHTTVAGLRGPNAETGLRGPNAETGLRGPNAETGLRGPNAEDRRPRPLAQGENRVEWTVTVPSPRRWWPRALGDQPLYDLRVAVLVPPGDAGGGGDYDADRLDPPGELSDERYRRLGLRTVTAHDWIFRINGERLFLKGAAQGPTRDRPAEATAAELAGDVHLAVDAGLDLLRLRAHVARPELYDEADRAGLLLWQDMPLQGVQHRSVRRQARRQARELVDLLGHHPSVALWCAHDEPEPLESVRDRSRRWGTGTRLAARTVVAHALPSWNRTILDRSVRAVLSGSDGSRPVVAHAGVLPHPPTFSGTDAHLSFGWYHHDERDLDAALRLWPRLARFVGSFGVPSVPDHAEALEPERWPDLDWERAAALGLERDVFDRVVPPVAFGSFADWAQATQEHQARLVRHHVETLRRIKYRPCGGFTMAAFADGSPMVSASVLDHRRAPKLAYAALAAACAPVVVVADRPPATVHAGQALALDVHVINDRRIALGDMMLTAYLRWGESTLSNPTPGRRSTTTAHEWRWRGDVPPDDCIRIGTVQAVAPDEPGPLVLDLQLIPAHDPDTVVAANRYATEVRAARRSGPRAI